MNGKTDKGPVFYVYEHWRPDRGVCFYVGKGHGRRAWSMRGRNRHHTAIVSKLTSVGMGVDVRIVISGISEQTAFSLEIDRIAMHPGLANKTPGGNGTHGWRLSDKVKERIRRSTAGRKLSEEHKAKVGAFFRGRKLSPEHVAKVSAANKGKRPSSQTLAAAAAVNRGRKASPGTVAKMSAARRGARLSPEHCAAIAAGQRGRPISDEQKAKLREAWKTRPPMTEETRKRLSEAATTDWAKRKAVA